MGRRWPAELEAVFGVELTEASQGSLFLKPGVLRYRTKTTKAGDMLESEVFPIWDTGAERRRARKHVTREAQKRVNARHSVRKLIRLVNANFTDTDLMVTLTYGPDELAPDFKQVQRDVRNFIRRLRDYRAREGQSELKYIYSVEGFRIEREDDQEMLPGVADQAPEVIERRGGIAPRPHVHMILSGMDRDAVERLWGKGWANCKRLQPDRYTGLEAVSRYMVKSWQRVDEGTVAPEGFPGKRWYSSRNLKKPTVTVSDWRMSRGKVQRAVAEIEDAPGAVFGDAYPGYELVDIEIKGSEYVSGVYIYAKMRKIKPAHPRRC